MAVAKTDKTDNQLTLAVLKSTEFYKQLMEKMKEAYEVPYMKQIRRK